MSGKTTMTIGKAVETEVDAEDSKLAADLLAEEAKEKAEKVVAERAEAEKAEKIKKEKEAKEVEEAKKAASKEKADKLAKDKADKKTADEAKKKKGTAETEKPKIFGVCKKCFTVSEFHEGSKQVCRKCNGAHFANTNTLIEADKLSSKLAADKAETDINKEEDNKPAEITNEVICELIEKAGLKGRTAVLQNMQKVISDKEYGDFSQEEMKTLANTLQSLIDRKAARSK